MYKFRIYVVDSTTKSQRSVTNLKEALNSLLGNQYELEVLDILKNALEAERDKIFATPTVVKVYPLPVTKMIGNFSNIDKLKTNLKIP